MAITNLYTRCLNSSHSQMTQVSSSGTTGQDEDEEFSEERHLSSMLSYICGRICDLSDIVQHRESKE